VEKSIGLIDIPPIGGDIAHFTIELAALPVFAVYSMNSKVPQGPAAKKGETGVAAYG
jgi:hypothetical protein